MEFKSKPSIYSLLTAGAQKGTGVPCITSIETTCD
jgi:hypothetical protein